MGWFEDQLMLRMRQSTCVVREHHQLRVDVLRVASSNAAVGR